MLCYLACPTQIEHAEGDQIFQTIKGKNFMTLIHVNKNKW